MDINQLSERAHVRLCKTLQQRQNVLSIPHRKALYALVESIMKMGKGKLTGRWAFPIATGCGKTTAVVECCATLHHEGDTTLSVVVCASRIEALCTMKKDMMRAGIPESKIGLIYANPTTKVIDKVTKQRKERYSLPCTIDNDSRQFLLVSHNRVATETHLAQINTYHGAPRSLVIYDESLLVSEIEHFSVDDLTGDLGKWIAKLKLDLRERPEWGNVYNWMVERQHAISEAYRNFNGVEENLLQSPGYMLTVEEQVDWQATLKHEGDETLSEFIAVQHLPLRLVRHNNTAVVSYKITIPEALTNMIVLDASYPIRKLEKDDATLQDAEGLPLCKTHRITFSSLKRFDNVKLYRMAQHGGRNSMANVKDKKKMKAAILDTVRIIQDIPQDESVLVFTYKAKGNVDPAKLLATELENANIPARERIHIQTWGNETSVNEYRHCRHVILVGILHRALTELEAHHLGQVNDIKKIVTKEDIHDLCLSERAHLAYQALSRGSCRVMAPDSQASPMTGYLIEAQGEIESELTSVMPGVVWDTWKPVYSNAVAHGQLQTTLKGRISTTLQTLPKEPISNKAFKAMVLNGEFVASQTWKRALSEALAENPQWNQGDRWIMPVEICGPFPSMKGERFADHLRVDRVA